jgi:hypothetical protein
MAFEPTDAAGAALFVTKLNFRTQLKRGLDPDVSGKTLLGHEEHKGFS